jgi:sterol desaturase/sphingolipid hydroxylase (fatty acid hydroxylase superfamily)
MSPDEAAHPYRESPTTARWVCIACYRSLSSSPGTCSRCHVDFLDLTRDDVRDEVRRHAEKRLYRRKVREEMVLGVIATVVGSVGALILWLVMFADEPSQDWRYMHSGERLPFIVGLGVSGVVYWVLRKIYLAVRRDAAIAIYASRQRRHAGGVASAEHVDPEIADMSQLLRFLGAKMIG